MYKWTTGAWEDAQHHWPLEKCSRNNNEIRLHTHQEDYNKKGNNNCWKGYEKSGTFLHCCTKIVYGDSVIPWLFMSLDFIWNVSFLFFSLPAPPPGVYCHAVHGCLGTELPSEVTTHLQGCWLTSAPPFSLCPLSPRYGISELSNKWYGATIRDV